jgi:hypothetical protein
MTCFSILKSLAFAAVMGVFITLAPLSAFAQTQPPPEEVEKLKAEDQRRKDIEAGKVDSPIVVELFTTADCTACVFADRILYDTMKEKNIIALSCKITDMSELQSQLDAPVKFGEENTPPPAAKKQKGPMDPCIFRQWAYRSSYANTETKITIPTFIFNGYDQIGGDDFNYYTQMLNSYHYSNKNKTLEVFMRWKDKDTIAVHLPEDPKAGKNKKSASVWIIRYKDMMVEKVEEGMNKGRVLRFSNIIQNIKHIGKWHSQMRTIEVDVPAPQGGRERGGYVIMVQEMMGQKVLAAGKLPDYPHPNDAKEKARAAGAKAPPRTAPTAAQKPNIQKTPTTENLKQ